MQDEISLLRELDDDDVHVLLRLYYQQEEAQGEIEDQDSLQRLLDHQLISSMVPDGAVVSLTQQGLAICDSLLHTRIEQVKPEFHQLMSALPQRAVACVVNRLLWRTKNKHGFEQLYESTPEIAWFEGVLMTVPEIQQIIGGMYMVLESVGLASKVNGQWYCPAEVEDFLRHEYGSVMDLSWAEEDSLKYYYFLAGYAHDQRHLIDFSSCESRYRSLLFQSETMTAEQWFSSFRLDPQSLIEQLDISKHRLESFLRRMQRQNIVDERYYPLTSFACFTEGDTMFVIKDIERYMEFITKEFLDPVTSSLMENRCVCW